MKRAFFSLMAFAWVILVVPACTKSIGKAADPQTTRMLCGSSAVYNADFTKIDANTTYNDLFKIFLAAGENYRNAVTNYDTIQYFKWYPCTDSAYYVECDLEAGRMLMAQKTIPDTSCSKNVSVSGYDSLKAGMALTDVQATLKGSGDYFRKDYAMPGNYLKTAWYRFADCTDTSRHIEVQFSPDYGLTQADKSF